MPAPSGAQVGGTLTKQEKDAIRKMYGNMASPLFHTVAKLYVCPQTGTRWQDTDVWGAICLVIDRSVQPPAYMVQILDLATCDILFSQELYIGGVYNSDAAQFHSFEVDSGFVGFSFADAPEAKEFGLKVTAAMPKNDPTATAQPAKANKVKQFLSKASMATGIQLPGVQQGMNISTPTGFQHLQHIGYDPAKGFECSDIPDSWKTMFRSAGIKKSDMQNPEKAAVIYAALQNELGDDFLEKPPPEMAPSGTSSKASKKTPPVPKRGAPAAPDAPEAPPAPPDAPEPPPSAPIFSGGGPSGGPAAPAKPSNARGGLLDDINKGGFKLKKVEEKDNLDAPGGRPKSASSATLPPDKVNSIMGALTQAMGERLKAVQSEDADDAVDDWSE